MIERKQIQSHVADVIERYSKTKYPITCKANCPNCCHVKVSVFSEEVNEIISLGIDIDMDKLEKQVNDWNNSDKTCVFLKEGNCSIHENKPLSCMAHLVNSPKENCHINSNQPTNRIQVNKANTILKKLRSESDMVILHEQLYKRL